MNEINIHNNVTGTNITINSKFVIEIYKYFENKYRISFKSFNKTIIGKRKVYKLLKKFNINKENAKIFMSKNAFNLGRKIFIPFEIGIPNENYNLIDQCFLLCRETTKSLRSFIHKNYLYSYVNDKNYRTLLYSDSIFSEMALCFYLHGIIPGLIWYKPYLKKFDFTETEFSLMENIMNNHIYSIKNTYPVWESTRSAIYFFEYFLKK